MQQTAEEVRAGKVGSSHGPVCKAAAVLLGGPQHTPLTKATGGTCGGASISRAWAGVIPGDRAGGGGTAVTELGSGCNEAERIPE